MPAEFVNFYAELGVPQSASSEQIREAYYRRSAEIHPDQSDDPGADEAQQRLNEAYEVLSDEEARKRYDELLRRRYAGSELTTRVVEPRRSYTYIDIRSVPAWHFYLQHVRQNLVPYLLYAGLGILVVAGVVSALRRPKTKRDLETAKVAEAEKELAATKLRDAEEETKRQQELDRAKRKQESAVATARLKSLQADGAEALSSLRSLESELDTWAAQIAPLLTNERGKFIAADESNVLAFEAIWNSNRPSKATLKPIRERIETVLRPVDEELAKPTPYFVPDESVGAVLELEKSRIEMLGSDVKVMRQQIERMLEVGERSGKKASINLERAIAQYRAQELEKKNKRLAEVERENQAKLVAAEEAAKRQEGEDRVKLADAKARAASLAAEEAVHRELLIKKAKSPETKQLLLLFLTPGYLQPDGTETNEKRPLSFGKVYARGALEESNEGRSSLWQIMTAVKDKERPVLKTKTINYSVLPDDRKLLVRDIQAALKELGPTLVDLGMMDP